LDFIKTHAKEHCGEEAEVKCTDDHGTMHGQGHMVVMSMEIAKP